MSGGSPNSEAGGRQPSFAERSAAPGTQRAQALAPASAYVAEPGLHAVHVCAPAGDDVPSPQRAQA